MKGTEQFKQTIKAYLDERAKTDELFAVSYAKENKNLDDCITVDLTTTFHNFRQAEIGYFINSSGIYLSYPSVVHSQSYYKRIFFTTFFIMETYYSDNFETNDAFMFVCEMTGEDFANYITTRTSGDF
jgi:hypothetical protein